MSITNADIKASGEIAVSPLVNRVRGSSSASSGSAKDTFKGHDATEHFSKKGHGVDPSKQTKAFERFGDESYYTPIDNYEGRHRYDPKFEWASHEERKLVRKVWQRSNAIGDRTIKR